MIRASELRNVATDYANYIAAFHGFRDKYFALPGDMKNATSFWGSLGGTGSDAACQIIPADAATGTATCNGDGDGSVLNGGVVNNYEPGRIWQHLANAGLITGQYTGTGVTGHGPLGFPGINVPRSKINNGYFVIPVEQCYLGWQQSLQYLAKLVEPDIKQ